MDASMNTFNPTGVSGKIAACIVTLTILYSVGLAFHRLFLSPLAAFPGPKIAALTGFYEFYYDFFKGGKYIFEIERMHEVYGPIVRINPQELSIRDSEFYDTLYVSASVRRTNGYHQFVKGLNLDGSHMLTVDHGLHRRRRKPLEPFFSRSGVARLQPMLAQVVANLVSRFEALKGTHSVVRLDHAFTALSGDVICKICSVEHDDFVQDPNFAPHWFNLLRTINCATPILVAFPSIAQALTLIPEAVAALALPGQLLTNLKNSTRKQIIDSKRDKNNAKKADVDSHGSFFRHILDSDMHESDLSVNRLINEAQVLVGAGSTTTSRTLDLISFYILANKDVRATLLIELEDVMKTYPEKVPSLAELEKLTYLQALIKEGLRLSYGTMHRLPRISPDVPLQYRQWTIPPGVPVGMSAYFMHTDPLVYEKPHKFIPERWLGDVDPLMKRNLVPFAKGSRSCLGMNLAYAEISLVLAVLFRPNGGPKFDLFETDESDVTSAHDFITPLPRLDSKGLRVMVH